MVMAVAFSPDDRYVATGHFDGTVVIFDAVTGSARLDFNISPPNRILPVTALRFHPAAPILVLTASDGTLEKRDIRSGEVLFHTKEENNEIYCLDYRRDGSYFATGGSDGSIRVYEDVSNRVVSLYRTITEHNANHPAGRMYAVVFSPDDLNLLFAGGWGNTVHVFDLRHKDAERKSLFGPYLTGDALDVRNGIIITASNRLEKRLEMIDSETGAFNDLGWPSQYNFCPTCAKQSHDSNGEFVAVGGGGMNGLDHAAFVLERRTGKCVVDQAFEGSVNACAFTFNAANSVNSNVVKVAFGDSAGQTHIFERPAPQQQQRAAK